MIFINSNGKLTPKKEINFQLEKHLQKLVEDNLGEILGLEFVATEFSIDSYRFDSIAYNPETKSFVIIEYKRGKNESLVDQGYAYLYTLLDRKADFVLLYNEVFKKSKGLKDFDWSQTRIIFISPQFTDYQKNATAFINMPFELYEIKRFEGDIISVNQVNQNKSVKTDTAVSTTDDKVSKVTKEIVIYTEDELLSKSTEFIKELYAELRNRILVLGNVKIEAKKLYVAFKGKTNICDVVISKNQLKIFVNLKEGQLKDSLKLARSVKEIGHWGNGDYEITIKDMDNLDYVISLIKQSYTANS